MGKTIIVKRDNSTSNKEVKYCKNCGGIILKTYRNSFCSRKCAESYIDPKGDEKPKLKVVKNTDSLPYKSYSVDNNQYQGMSQTEKFNAKYGRNQNVRKRK